MTESVFYGYRVIILMCLTGFALYDIFKRRVPDIALLWLLPVFLIGPHIVGGFTGAGDLYSYLTAVFAASLAFAVMLGAAFLSKDNCGVGGGDIKLSAALGFVYGPFGIMAILLIASLFAALFGLAYKKGGDRGKMSLPFVPFLAFGCLLLTAAEITCM